MDFGLDIEILDPSQKSERREELSSFQKAVEKVDAVQIAVDDDFPGAFAKNHFRLGTLPASDPDRVSNALRKAEIQARRVQ